MRFSILPSSFFLFTLACTLTLPQITFPTPVPVSPTVPPIPAATPIPLPTASLTFRVHLPPDVSSADAVSLLLLDEVTGLTLNPSPQAMEFAGGDAWVATLSAPIGALLKYRYTVGGVDETFSDGGVVAYRTWQVAGEGTVEDWMAGRGGQAAGVPIGRISGAVKDASTGQGVTGVIVSAGGRQAFTGFDGAYAIEGLPPGTQTLTAFAVDGSYRVFQQGAVITANGVTPADILLSPARPVQVTFRVRIPADTAPDAPLFLAGNALQLGDAFAGSQSVLAARMPKLEPQADGTRSFSVRLFAGSDLRYKYTLGDGFWNAERDARGLLRLRQVIVPDHDLTLDDTVDAWRGGPSSPVTFQVTVPASTPASDVVVIQFNPFGWLNPLLMWRAGTNEWKYVLYSPLDFGGEIGYRYCRNFACGAADEKDMHAARSVGRPFLGTILPQTLVDTVTRWMWSDSPPAYTPILPAQVSPRPEFQAGAVFSPDYRPEWLIFYPAAMDELRADRANWIQFDARWRAGYSTGAPRIFFSPDASPLRPDLLGLLNAAHAPGLRVALAPTFAPPDGNLGAWWSIGGPAPGATGWWNEWFAQYRNLLLYHAQLAEETHSDVLVIGSYLMRPALPGEPEAPPDAEARWRSLTSDVRAHYHGRLAFELNLRDTLSPPPPFLDAVDEITVKVQSPFFPVPVASVGEMQSAAGVLFDAQLLPIQSRFNKPIIISADYLAVYGTAMVCVRVGGDCHATSDIAGFSPFDPEDGGEPLDLAGQADVYDALLLAVNDRPWISGFFSGGWFPPVALRDKSPSVRGKPAEDVLKAWFTKLVGQ